LLNRDAAQTSPINAQFHGVKLLHPRSVLRHHAVRRCTVQPRLDRPMSKNTMSTASQPEERIAFSIRAAAEALSISERTIAALIASGRLESVRVGRRRLIPRTELERLIVGA
jgi:excisionase family DNA binding protein